MNRSIKPTSGVSSFQVLNGIGRGTDTNAGFMVQPGSGTRIIRKTAMAVAIGTALMSTAQIQAAENDLEQITVTATRRETSIMDVPYNISAYSGVALEKLEIQELGEFVRFVPGLTYTDVGIREQGNNNTLIMRGLSAQPQGGAGDVPNLARSSVSMYVGETPVYYNLRLTDVERIEVLRGPQGTLYGAGSLGGTIRIIPNNPDPEGFDAIARGSISSTNDASDPNWDADVMLNLPFGENAAFRMSGGHAYQAGFVDATGLGLRAADGSFLLEDPSDFLGSGPDLSGYKKDSNDGEVNHFRAALLANFSDNVEAVLTYQYQDSETGNYQSSSLDSDRTLDLRGLNPFESKLQLGSLEITAELGFATLTSSTSYYEVTTDSTVDASGLYEDFYASFYFYYPRISTLADYSDSDNTFAQEVRLTSSGDNRVDWIVGAFFLDQEMKFDTVQTMPGFEDWYEAAGLQAYFGTPIPLTNPPNLVFQEDRKTTFKEAALFGELTYHVTDQWQLTGGVRIFQQKIDNSNNSILPTCYNILESFGLGFYCGSPPLGGASVDSKDKLNDQVFKFNTLYALNEATNAYFTFSQGFRNGGVNALPTVGYVNDTLGGEYPDINTFYADKVNNWELGLKGNLDEGNLSYSVALYYEDWEDPQSRIVGALSGIPGVSNSTADATSKGVELELQGVAGENWNYTLGYTYTDAEFSEDGELYTTVVEDGYQLPGTSKSMLSGMLSYYLPVGSNSSWLFSTDAAYRSSFENALPGQIQEYHIDGYTIWNADITYQVNSWSFRLFAKNLGDEDAVAAASLVGPLSSRLVIGQPRTFGIRVTYQYQ